MMRRPAAVLFDLDGTIWDDDAVLPGVPDAVARVRAAGIRTRFVTNITRLPARALRDRLAAAGMPTPVEDVQTAPVAAAHWLRHGGIERVALYVAAGTREDFSGFTPDDAAPEAIVVGDLGSAWNFERLNRAFLQVMGGARLVALQRNRYWLTGGALALDAGAFVAALEYATGREAVVVGKPSRAFFDAAVRAVGCPPADVVCVGDDVANDIAGARAVGCRGVLVRTGKYRPGDETTVDPGPDALVDSVADLPGLFGI
jgi:HAD superfamily hydrolase (TIGR01458 family)